MKNLKKYLLLFFMLLSVSIFAQTQSSGTSAREAANKGKAELLKVLSDSKEFNLGVTASDVEGSEVGNPVEELTADFKSLVNNQNSNLSTISSRTERLIFPLVKNDKVVTIITVASTPKRYKAVELANRQYTSELNQITRATSFQGLKLILVPNINAAVYVMDDRAFTSYNGRSIREATSLSDLTAELQKDAREFDVKFGEELRKGKLVR